jgi:AraC family transcriptional regulator
MKRVQEHLKILESPCLLAAEPLQRIAKRLFAEFRSPDASASLAMEALAMEMLVFASRTRAASATGEPAWMRQLRTTLHDRFAESLSMTQLAELAGVHESHLARAFHRHHGCTVGDYTRQLRLDAASRLLSGSEMPLAEIAYEVGFCDQAHFSRAFRSAYGATPSTYRKLSRPR